MCSYLLLEVIDGSTILIHVEDERPKVRVVAFWPVLLAKKIPDYGFFIRADSGFKGPATHFTALATEYVYPAQTAKITILTKISKKIAAQRAIVKEFWNQSSVPACRLEALLTFESRD